MAYDVTSQYELVTSFDLTLWRHMTSHNKFCRKGPKKCPTREKREHSGVVITQQIPLLIPYTATYIIMVLNGKWVNILSPPSPQIVAILVVAYPILEWPTYQLNTVFSYCMHLCWRLNQGVNLLHHPSEMNYSQLHMYAIHHQHIMNINRV